MKKVWLAVLFGTVLCLSMVVFAGAEEDSQPRISNLTLSDSGRGINIKIVYENVPAAMQKAVIHVWIVVERDGEEARGYEVDIKLSEKESAGCILIKAEELASGKATIDATLRLGGAKNGDQVTLVLIAYDANGRASQPAIAGITYQQKFEI